MKGAERAEVPVVVEKVYAFVQWLLPKVESYPRSFRFSVGDRTVTAGLDLLQTLVDAAYTSRKAPFLETASQRVNGLRYLLRLAKDLRLISVDSYSFSAEQIEEIGRMVGGWLKAERAKA